MSTLCRAFAFVAIFALSFGVLMPWLVSVYLARIDEPGRSYANAALEKMTATERAEVLSDGIVTIGEINAIDERRKRARGVADAHASGRNDSTTSQAMQ